MLELSVRGGEFYDERSNLFIEVKPTKIRLEHSLVSVSKWEAKWRKPFFSQTERKTLAESRDYIRCMTLTQNVDPNVYLAIDDRLMEEVNEYISAERTATTFTDQGVARGKREVITSELIYWMMVNYGIPFECQKWHLSRLMTLIRICTIKAGKPKKMSKRDVMAQNRALNAARKAKHHTKG